MGAWQSTWDDKKVSGVAGAAALEQELLSQWTHQLYREYDHICYLYSLKLPKPLIRIEDTASTWATWQPELRTITVSKRLIREHAWDVVLEILKHEMAHQWVSVHYGDGAETAHGERFQTACRRLGVADWAARAGGALPQELVPWQERCVTKEEERILERVEKLLALANSSNEHEAVLAMQRVREMQERYKLETIGRGGQDDMVSVHLTRKQKKFSAVESMIFSILVEHFQVRVVTCKMFDAAALAAYCSAEVLGSRHDVLMAEYVHNFLWERAHAFWRLYRQERAASARAKNSYMLGLLAGFRDNLSKSKQGSSSSLNTPPGGSDRAAAQALILASGDELEAFMARRHPRLSKRSVQTTVRDGASYSAGKAEGARLSLNRPVDGQNVRLLLGK